VGRARHSRPLRAGFDALLAERRGDQLGIERLRYFLHFAVGDAVDLAIRVVVRLAGFGGRLAARLYCDEIAVGDEVVEREGTAALELYSQGTEEFAASSCFPL
jgi:hypothetical protein